MKHKIVWIRIIKGFAKGRVCSAQVIYERGLTIYRCFPDNAFYIDYTGNFVEIIKRESK